MYHKKDTASLTKYVIIGCMVIFFLVIWRVCVSSPFAELQVSTQVGDSDCEMIYEHIRPAALSYEQERAVVIGDNLLKNASISVPVFPQDAGALVNGDLFAGWRTNYMSSLATNLTITFTELTTINKIIFFNANHLRAYKIMGSADGEHYELITFAGTNGTHNIAQVFESASVSSLKITIYGPQYHAAVSIGELSIEHVNNEPISRVIPHDIIEATVGTKNLLQTAAAVTTNMASADAAILYDGDINEPWRTYYAENAIAIIDVDLGSNKPFNKYALFNLWNTESYTVAYSTDGITYQPIPQAGNMSANIIQLFDVVTARYIRLTVTGVAGGAAISIGQFVVEHTADMAAEQKNMQRLQNPQQARADDLQNSLRNDMVLFVGSNKVLLNGQPTTLQPPMIPFHTDGEIFVPAQFIAPGFGGIADWMESTQTMHIALHNTSIWLNLAEQTMTLNSAAAVALPQQLLDGQLMVSLQAFCSAMGKQAFADQNGLILIGDSVAETYDFINNDTLLSEITHLLLLERPPAQDIMLDMQSHGLSLSHPRLFGTAVQPDALRRSYADPVHSTVSDAIIRYADNKLETVIEVGHSYDEDISYLAAAYLLTAKPTYKQKLWETLEETAHLKVWGGNSLELASVAKAFALAYDWLYDDWTAEQKEILRDAIRNKSLLVFDQAYTGKNYALANDVANHNNIGAVTNAAAVMSALAIYETDPALSAHIMAQAIRSVENVLANFQPQGAWMEGAHYWNVTVKSTAQLISALEYATGSDYGLSALPGLSQTGYFILSATGPKGKFNFNDARADTSFNVPSELLWLAHTYNDGALGGMRKKAILNSAEGTVDDLIWYDPLYADDAAHLPLDSVFARTESGALRSAWDDPEGMYLGFKGGMNGESHGSLNSGTFVLDAGGERWVLQLGQDRYDLPGNFTYGPRAERWRYYRYRGEGNNTLILHPTETEDMVPYSYVPVVKNAWSSVGAYAIVNTTLAYMDVRSAKRGFILTDNRTRAVIQDEVLLRNASDLWWFAHTRADIKIIQDGRKAILELNGKRMGVSISGDENLQFVVMDASPLTSSPNPEGQNRNEGIRKLAIHGVGKKEYTFAVSFMLLEQAEPEHFAYIPLKHWTTI